MMRGSYHTLDRLAREMAGDLAAPPEEQLRVVEAKFAEYVERREADVRWLRQRTEDLSHSLKVQDAANRDLLRQLAAYRGGAR